MTDLDELKRQFLEELEEQDELTHHGVPGMKWGKHKSAGSSSSSSSAPKKPGFFDKPSAAKAVLTGSYGKKSSYTDPHALAVRKAAGKLRLAAVIGTAGSMAISKLAPSSSAAQITAGLVSSAAGAVSLASLISGATGAQMEKNARKSA